MERDELDLDLEEGEDEEEDESYPGANYDNFAYYYDLQYSQRDSRQDLDFYRELARKAGANPRLLELACGSGRLTIPLAKAGFRITGLDLSEPMLDIARQKVAQESPEVQKRVKLVQGDMRNLDEVLGNEQFDMIFIAINSFQHLLTQADQLACLQSVRKHLAPVGLFIVDVFNPEEKENYPADGRMEFNGTVYNPERHSAVQIFLSTLARPAEQQRDYHFFYDEMFADGTLKRTVARLTLRYFYRYELQLLLERAGFSITDLYGSYYFDEYAAGSDKLIYICRKG